MAQLLGDCFRVSCIGYHSASSMVIVVILVQDTVRRCSRCTSARTAANSLQARATPQFASGTFPHSCPSAMAPRTSPGSWLSRGRQITALSRAATRMASFTFGLRPPLSRVAHAKAIPSGSRRLRGSLRTLHCQRRVSSPRPRTAHLASGAQTLAVSCFAWGGTQRP
jgi:hypothetical protein